MKKENVFETPWFSLVAQDVPGHDQPFYYLSTFDWVSVFAITEDDEVLLVRQFRPAVQTETFELPAGNMDPGEEPLESARRELLEETGYTSDEICQVGPCMNPDTGRLSNQMWCFFAPNARKVNDMPVDHPEGIVLHKWPLSEFVQGIRERKFHNALNLTAFWLSVMEGKVPLQILRS